MKTWRLTTKQPGKPRTKQPDPEVILVESDRLLVGKFGALIFVRDGEDSGWGSNVDDPFYQIDGGVVVRVQGAGCYSSCDLVEAPNHDRGGVDHVSPGESH